MKRITTILFALTFLALGGIVYGHTPKQQSVLGHVTLIEEGVATIKTPQGKLFSINIDGATVAENKKIIKSSDLLVGDYLVITAEGEGTSLVAKNIIRKFDSNKISEDKKEGVGGSTEAEVKVGFFASIKNFFLKIFGR